MSNTRVEHRTSQDCLIAFVLVDRGMPDPEADRRPLRACPSCPSAAGFNAATQQALVLSPLGAQVAPENVLSPALFLASGHARHVTGQDVNVTVGVIMY
ncbi:hypothetical protein GCM10022222_10160 [Amycolatopsis ultiminotia]|uniref:Uncharacterized protein n=1 Tax=Amycolatopsis ultiminotia TaxID=543629 RepID=A0ABP6V5X5_9PSEU